MSFLLIAVPPTGCALVGYNFDGYGPASAGGGQGGSSSSDQSTTGSSGDDGGTGVGGSPSGAGGSPSGAGGSPSGAGGSPPACAIPAECGASTDCISYACLNGVCSAMITALGTSCNKGSGKCNLTGQCVQCFDASECPPASNECQTAACSDGHCGIVNKAAATLCNNGADQCDGAGKCVDCVNSGGCEECCTCLGGVCIPALGPPHHPRAPVSRRPPAR